jgi:hypothetical protein
MPIPWLGVPAKSPMVTRGLDPDLWETLPASHCWENGAIEFLVQNYSHKEAYVQDVPLSKPVNTIAGSITTYERLITKDLFGNWNDVAATVIQNGYGTLAIPDQFLTYPPPPPLYVNGELVTTTLDPATTKYLHELDDLRSVSSLAQKGLWGACSGK